MLYEETFEFFKELKFRNVKDRMYMIGDLGSIINRNNNSYLSTYKSEKGYSMVGLMCNDNRRHTFKLHRIVAVNFLGDRSNEGLEIDHIDGNKDNNAADNLEWVTHKENIKRANEKGLITYHSGVDVYNSKFSNKDIRYICSMLEYGLSNKQIRKICKRANVDLSVYNLYDIRHRKSYTEISKDYNF